VNYRWIIEYGGLLLCSEAQYDAERLIAVSAIQPKPILIHEISCAFGPNRAKACQHKDVELFPLQPLDRGIVDASRLSGCVFGIQGGAAVVG